MLTCHPTPSTPFKEAVFCNKKGHLTKNILNAAVVVCPELAHLLSIAALVCLNSDHSLSPPCRELSYGGEGRGESIV